MLQSILTKIKDQDQFAFSPASAISFNKKQIFATLPGGFHSILLSTLFLILWYQNFYQMFFYQNNSITSNTSYADLIKLGNVKMNEMKMIPFVAPYYKGKMVPRQSMDMCKEFEGDCFKFVNKYLKIQWDNFKSKADYDQGENNYFESKICTPEDIT